MRRSFIDSWHRLQDTCLRTVIIVFYSPNVLGGHSPRSALFWSSGHLLGGLPATQHDLGMDAKATRPLGEGTAGGGQPGASGSCLGLSLQPLSSLVKWVTHKMLFRFVEQFDFLKKKKKSTFQLLTRTPNPHTSEMKCGFIYPLCFFVKHNTYRQNWKPSWFLL